MEPSLKDNVLPENAERTQNNHDIQHGGRSYSVSRWPVERVMHLKAVLSSDEQASLMPLIARLTKKKQHVTKPGSEFTIFWTGEVLDQDQRAFEAFRAVARKAACVAHSLESGVHEEYNPIYHECYSYSPPDGKLKEHIDCILGWIVILTLGCSVRFFFCGPSRKVREVITVNSGDFVVFNGSFAHRIRHGVDSIVPDSCPPNLQSDLQSSRLALQFRQAPNNAPLTITAPQAS